jgi:lipopolysaccharide/colanic/teichoic acid biosynthesis glycosyltransferase
MAKMHAVTPGKRVADLLFALFLSVVLAPVIVAVALLVWHRQGRPILYGSERMRGPDEAFILWKFRTMAADPSDGGVTGGDKSARITPLGATLRRLRLDELPQLWNVLRGDVSFVGPRPPLRRYVEMFPDLYARVLRSRPGITGLATLVYAPHEERLLASCATPEATEAAYIRRCIPRKAMLDLLYQRHRSFWMDMKLVSWTTAKFFPKAIRPKRKGRWV